MMLLKFLIFAFLAIASRANPIELEELVNKFGNDLEKLKEEFVFDHEDIYLDVPELIEKYGYPCEVHDIVTEDGYILQAHRIPYGKNSGPAADKPVIWLQHGLMSSSADWVVTVEKAFGYILADKGYDVWMGNARGNKYSKRHTTLTPKDSKFWDFSWNEMGVYDIPAVLNYVTEYTGQEKIYYVGHSMGTTMFTIAMSEKPELNDKIRLAFGIGPAAYTTNMISPIRLLAPFWNQVEWLANMIGLDEFLPAGPLFDFLGASLCREESLFQPICFNILFIAMGYNVDQLNKTQLPIILGHAPAGSSSQTVLHYAQGVKEKDFRKYDYGKSKNFELYGTEIPPKYELSKITCPMAIYWGENDWLATRPDVYRLAEQITNLVRIHRVAHDKWNHVDFLWGIDAGTLLYEPMMELMSHF